MSTRSWWTWGSDPRGPALRMLAATLLLLALPLGVRAGDLEGTVTATGVRSPADVAVYLGEKLPPDKLPPPARNPVMDQRKLIFIPHVMCITLGTTVDFPNNDEVPHNVFSPGPVKKFNLGTYQAGVVKQVTFDKAGLAPLLCNIHPEMSAYILVLETPHAAITDKSGAYRIAGIPAGTYTVKTWHEKLKPAVQEVTIPADGAIRLDIALRR